MKLKVLIGAGDKIGKVVLPFLLAGVAANVWRPALFGVGGPFALAKHPLYTGVSLLVLLPWLGFLLNTWLGALLGVVMYMASRRYAPAEEQALAAESRREWDEYFHRVKLPWL